MSISNISNIIIDKVDKINNYRNSATGKNLENQNTVTEKSQHHDMSTNEIHEIVDNLNNTTSILNERVSFSYHEKTKRVIVKVIDSDTNEVVREIPPKDLIKLLEHIQEYMGMFVDESR